MYFYEVLHNITKNTQAALQDMDCDIDHYVRTFTKKKEADAYVAQIRRCLKLLCKEKMEEYSEKEVTPTKYLECVDIRINRLVLENKESVARALSSRVLRNEGHKLFWEEIEARKPNFSFINKKEVVACFNTRNQYFKATHVEIELSEGTVWKHVRSVRSLPCKEVITLRLMYWPSDQGIRHTEPINIFIKEDKSFRLEGEDHDH